MTCNFTPFSIVFQSYQNDERLIMKGCVQWNMLEFKRVILWKQGLHQRSENCRVYKYSGPDQLVSAS